MVQYIKFFGTEVSDTEDKTTFEELLKNTPEQKAEAHKVERAYHLISQGYWSDADALFDEVLADDPKNSEALMGKQLISRRSRISGRMNSLDARAYKATTREKAAEKIPCAAKRCCGDNRGVFAGVRLCRRIGSRRFAGCAGCV